MTGEAIWEKIETLNRKFDELGVGGRSYPAYPQVPGMTEEFCLELQIKRRSAVSIREQYELSFNAHLNLITIDPWIDGNGRTSRLLMNYLQFGRDLFPVKVFKEDRGPYILSLRQAQDEGDNASFLAFMAGQLLKRLQTEIEKADRAGKKGFSLMF